MTLLFTQEALRDLDELDAFLSVKSPAGLKNVLAALRRAFELVEANPRLGRETFREGVRLIIEPKYKYIVPYLIDGGGIWILRVYHPSRLPLDLANLILP